MIDIILGGISPIQLDRLVVASLGVLFELSLPKF
jgi:hypothetical protein